MSRKEFDAAYADYVDGIFWDESMFQEMTGAAGGGRVPGCLL